MQPQMAPENTTDWNRLRCKNQPRFQLLTQENQHPAGTTSIAMGIPDSGMAPQMLAVPLKHNEIPGSSSRHKAGFSNYTTMRTRRLELPCLAQVGILLGSSLPP